MGRPDRILIFVAGAFIVLSSLVALFQNQQDAAQTRELEKQQECVIDAFTNRDLQSRQSRLANEAWLLELRHTLLMSPESIDPVIESIDKAIEESRAASRVVKVNDLRDCLTEEGIEDDQADPEGPARRDGGHLVVD